MVPQGRIFFKNYSAKFFFRAPEGSLFSGVGKLVEIQPSFPGKKARIVSVYIGEKARIVLVYISLFI